MKRRPLTPLTQRFIAEYLAAPDQNAEAAMLRAGYKGKHARQYAYHALQRAEVMAEIQRKLAPTLKRLEITKERVLEELAKIGFANMQDYIAISGDGTSFDVDFSKLTREQAAAIQEITVDATGGVGDGERRQVLRTRFKLAEKRGALELMGKYLKLFTDKVESSGPDGGPIQENITVTFVKPK